MKKEVLPSRSRFGPFDVDFHSGELRRHGLRVKLHDKPFRVLAALLERPGQLVRREELRGRLWPDDTFVDFDNNLNTTVNKLREALGDSAEDPRFIETLPRKGYRFIGELQPATSTSVDANHAPSGLAGRRMGLPAVAVALILLLIASALYLLTVQPTGARPPADRRMMLAVLPFENLSAVPDQQYFSDGLTEELITHLARLEPARLGVIARTSAMSYKGTRKTIEQVGAELGVDYVLEGSVRRSGTRLRVSAQLIQVNDQTHIWAQTYERSMQDVFAIESDLVARIARSLTLRLLPGDSALLARASTTSTEAYEAYLRGRFAWNEMTTDGVREAVEHFKRAITLDPNYALAYAGLANAYNMSPAQASTQAKQAAQKALALAPDLPEAHNALAYAYFQFDWNFKAAVRHFERALELNPGFSLAHHWYSRALSALGRHEEALAAVRRALELDPNSPGARNDLGWYLLYADRYEEAIQACEETLERMPNHYGSLQCLAEGYALKGRMAEAAEVNRKLMSLAGVDPVRLAAWHDPDPRAEMRNLSRALVQQALRNLGRGSNTCPLSLAVNYAKLGENDQALEWLEKAVEERNGLMVFLRVDPRFDSLHGDPRFRKLAARIGLPQT